MPMPETCAGALGGAALALCLLAAPVAASSTADPAVRLQEMPSAAGTPRDPWEIRQISWNAAWLDAQPEASGGAEFECLAQALYFEARGEPVRGQAAVAEVILNRVENPDFPDTVCAVVNQGGAKGCQFSFACDGLPEAIHERDAYDRAAKVARAMLDGAPRGLTGGATHFHTPAVSPGWARRFERTAEIGGHVFYRQPVRTAMN